MPKVTIKLNAKRVTRRVKTQIGRAMKKIKVDNILKEEMVKSIRGEGFFSSPKLPSGEKVKPIQRKTKIRRRELATSNPTHPTFRPGKSNLTLTGELLDKGIKSGFRASKLEISIEAKKGFHKLYKKPKLEKKRKRRRKKGKRVRSTYSKIFEGQADQGRDVFDFGEKFLTKVGRQIVKQLKKIL